MGSLSRKEIRMHARQFAKMVAEISSSWKNWRAFYEEFSVAICERAKELAAEHPRRAERLVLLGSTFHVLGMSVTPIGHSNARE